MTIIDTTLYANGALRLSRHGVGKGETVLTHTPSGKQAVFEDQDTEHIISYITYEIDKRHRTNALNIFEEITDRLGTFA